MPLKNLNPNLMASTDAMMPNAMGIELDDSSHERQKTIERDNFVNELYMNAGFPLFRFKASYGYAAEEIKNALGQILFSEKQ